jgi:DNA-binding beta-propeller fold protein YncE
VKAEGGEDGQFIQPGDVAVDSDDTIYVPDYGNNRIQIFINNGTFLTKFGSKGSEDGKLNQPTVIAFPDGFLYVTDSENHRVQVFNKNGTFVTKWGSEGEGDGQFSQARKY